MAQSKNYFTKPQYLCTSNYKKKSKLELKKFSTYGELLGKKTGKLWIFFK